jgi:hypothetical protein
LFVADIHNVERVVTAVNMKPYWDFFIKGREIKYEALS